MPTRMIQPMGLPGRCQAITKPTVMNAAKMMISWPPFSARFWRVDTYRTSDAAKIATASAASATAATLGAGHSRRPSAVTCLLTGCTCLTGPGYDRSVPGTLPIGMERCKAVIAGLAADLRHTPATWRHAARVPCAPASSGGSPIRFQRPEPTLDAASRPARMPKGTTVPANRRRVKQTILLQQGTIDISRESASPMPPMRPLPVRHLLKGSAGRYDTL
jgi:hypothetical protein